MDKFPRTVTERLRGIATETARMSYPGRMSGLVTEGTKRSVEQYFVEAFPLKEIWDDALKIALSFDEWHDERIKELSQVLHEKKCLKDKHNRVEALAAKFLNTFLFQLVKYEQCRPLWNVLHLPLDGRVLKKLRSLCSPALQSIGGILSSPPYSLSYAEYIQVQDALSQLVVELNRRPDVEFRLESRIELNLLWVNL